MASVSWGKVAGCFLIVLGLAGAWALPAPGSRTMPGDFPDYGVPSATVYPVSDMGELAARLGSIATFDRRGNLVWSDDFEATLLKWVTATSGAGSSVGLVTTTAWRGNQCVRLVSGATDGFNAQISKSFYYPVLSRVGIEWAFKMQSAATPEGILTFGLTLDSGSAQVAATIILDAGAAKVYVQDEDLGQVELGTWNARNGAHFWEHMKLVVDASTGRYIRLVLNNVEYDLSAYSLLVGIAPFDAELLTAVTLESDAAAAETAYVDDFILTQNEP